MKEKITYLKESGTLNPKASEVKDELFIKNDFFDPRDIVQVKYEMLRKVSKENYSVQEAIHLFGMSRPYYYKLKKTFTQKGMTGLLPQKRGPKGGFKITGDMIAFIDTTVHQEPTLNSRQIAQKIEAQFHISLHPRTIERMRKRQKK